MIEKNIPLELRIRIALGFSSHHKEGDIVEIYADFNDKTINYFDEENLPLLKAGTSEVTLNNQVKYRRVSDKSFILPSGLPVKEFVYKLE